MKWRQGNSKISLKGPLGRHLTHPPGWRWSNCQKAISSETVLTWWGFPASPGSLNSSFCLIMSPWNFSFCACFSVCCDKKCKRVLAILKLPCYGHKDNYSVFQHLSPLRYCSRHFFSPWSWRENSQHEITHVILLWTLLQIILCAALQPESSISTEIE